MAAASTRLDPEAVRALEKLARAFAGDGQAAPLDIPAHVATALLGEDLASRAGRGYVLTDAGRAWLKRRSAVAEPFREQHQLLESVVVDRGARHERRAIVNAGESPLGWLRSRKDRMGRPLITAEQFAAGERLRADHWRAHLSPRVTANWGAMAPSRRMRRGAANSTAVMADEAIAAKRRISNAIEAVGPELAGVLIAVCCELQGLEQAEKEEGWPQRAGKVVLQLALTRLARHYGFLPKTEGSQTSGRMRHWGASDYRPSLD